MSSSIQSIAPSDIFSSFNLKIENSFQLQERNKNTHEACRYESGLTTHNNPDKNKAKTLNDNAQKWLSMYGLKPLNLTLADLCQMSYMHDFKSRNNPSTASDLTLLPLRHSEFRLSDLLEFETNLLSTIENIINRICWYRHGSRRLFGVNREAACGLLVESSDRFLLSGHRGTHLRTCLREYIDNEWTSGLVERVYFVTYGSCVTHLWPSPQPLTQKCLTEVKHFCTYKLQAGGGSNLLAGLKHMLQVAERHNLTGITVVVGTEPDQEIDLLVEFFEQSLVGKQHLRFTFVAFDCVANSRIESLLSRLAMTNETSLHVYSSNQNGSTTLLSNELGLLGREVEEANEILTIVQTLRQSAMDDVAVGCAELPGQSEPGTGSGVGSSLHLPPETSGQLKCIPNTSVDWLLRHGLKATNLHFFEMLAPYSYKQTVKYVESIDKRVTGQVYEQAMVQVQWPDESIKHVHISLSRLVSYQALLAKQMSLYEQRIAWLGKNGRNLFGTIVNHCAIIILDLSIDNQPQIGDVKLAFKHLLEHQLGVFVETFNVITIGQVIQAFQPSSVETSRDNLEAAWRWLQLKFYGGSRNFLAAIRMVFETKMLTPGEAGIYLYSSAIPDQEIEPLVEYLSTWTAGLEIHLHTILFTPDNIFDAGKGMEGRLADAKTTAHYLRRMAHCTGGRFHWFGQEGIVESDDVAALLNEITQLVHFAEESQILVEKLKRKSEDHLAMLRDTENCTRHPASSSRPAKPVNFETVPATALTKARQQFIRRRHAGGQSIPKSLAYRGLVKTPVGRQRQAKISPAFFYTEVGNDVAAIFSSSSAKSSLKKPNHVITESEELMSSSHWLRKYSLRSLGLNFNRLFAGPKCHHEHKLVEVTRFCSEKFPLIRFKGQLRHVQFTSDQIEAFKNKVVEALKRYVKRMDWLITSPRVEMGVMLESCVILVIDISGSMEDKLIYLKQSLETVIQKQINNATTFFNLIAFNSDVFVWRPVSPARVDSESCSEAVAWLHRLRAWGGTRTGVALALALQQAKEHCKTQSCTSHVGIYLITDGTADQSCAQTLSNFNDAYNNTCKLNKKQKIKPRVHSVYFGEQNVSVEIFLQTMSHRTQGRFFSMIETREKPEWRTRLNSLRKELQNSVCLDEMNCLDALPNVYSDDLRLIVNEINKCLRILTNLKIYWKLNCGMQKSTPLH